MYTTLIEPEELAPPLARNATATSDWAILDCRFDLARPEWGAAVYTAGHIPHALYAHLDHDLSGAISPRTGRHPLPPPEQLAATLGRWGIDEKVQVVVYDQGNGAYAARLWWLLRWLGHRNVALLNGGFAAWQQAKLPVDAAPVQREPRTFVPRAAAEQVVTTAELESALQTGELAGGKSTSEKWTTGKWTTGKWMLVDARAADRFAGQNETIDPVAGHIPGAHNHPFARNLDAQGRFLPAQELRARWEATLGGGVRGAEGVIAMCGSGVTACHNLLALEIAGLAGARLYAGSWSEWIRAPQRAVERST